MPRQFKRLSHSLYECKYHIVFCPKYRHRIFRNDIAAYTQQALQELCRRKEDVEVLEVNVQPDHIHLVVSIAPKYAVSEFMGYLKGKFSTSPIWVESKCLKRYKG
jgi:putative transposase